MVVDQPGAGKTAVQIDDLGARSLKAQHFCAAAGCENLSLPDGHRLAGSFLATAPDAAVVKDEIGFNSDCH
ncbi:hypothetical protein D3C87_2179070 [compost metagenome]